MVKRKIKTIEKSLEGLSEPAYILSQEIFESTKKFQLRTYQGFG